MAEAKLAEYVTCGDARAIENMDPTYAQYITGSHLKESIGKFYHFTLGALLKRMVNPPINDPQYTTFAASRCKVAVEILRDFNFTWTHSAYIAAAESGRVDVLKYLYNNKCPGGNFTKYIIEIRDPDIKKILIEAHVEDFESLLMTGNPYIIEHALQQNPTIATIDHFRTAISRGDVAAVKLLAKYLKIVPKTEEWINLAASKGKIEVMRCLRDIGMPWTSNAYRYAAINGYGNGTLTFLCEQGCPVGDFTDIAETLKNKYPNISNYLLELSIKPSPPQLTPDTICAVDDAIALGNDSIVTGECSVALGLNTQLTPTPPTNMICIGKNPHNVSIGEPNVSAVQPTLPTVQPTTEKPVSHQTLDEILEKRVAETKRPLTNPIIHQYPTPDVGENTAWRIAYEAYSTGIIPQDRIEELGKKLVAKMTPQEFARLKYLFTFV